MGNSVILNKSKTSGFSYFVSSIYDNNKSFLIILKDFKDIEDLVNDISTLNFLPINFIFYFLPHNEEKLDLYIKTKAVLELYNNHIKGKIFIFSHQSLREKVASLESFNKSKMVIKKNEKIERDKFLETLNLYNYERVDRVKERGQYSVRGSIIDFYPYAETHPVRVEFWGDIVESVRVFSEYDQLTIKKIRELSTYLIHYKYYEDIDLESLINNRFDVALLETEEPEEFNKKVGTSDNFYITSFIPPWQNSDLIIDLPQSYFGNIALFKSNLKHLLNDYSVNIFLSTEGLIERFSEIMNELGLFFIEGEKLKTENSHVVNIVKGRLSSGFLVRSRKLIVITEKEILGKRRPSSFVRHERKKALHDIKISNLKEGDFVVHKNYGIGIYRGLTTIEENGEEKEYILIEYKDNDKLYLSPQKFYLLKKYVGSSPTLHKLKGGEWKKVKERVKKEAQEIAKELYELYMERKSKKGYAFLPDSQWQRELELSFPYNETEDQLKALKEVKEDMEKEVPMERIICGDVGYGKTEIAIRAAFKAVESGKQVAFLVPTTILASQHYETFKERLSPFPVKLDVLSRFRTQKEQKKIIDELAKGEIDILIGTHRILQKDVKFKDLGLLIIDEEQRFGVLHKERLKELKKDVDVLILTATPIPRTLYMALTGIRDLSLITTPPENRLSIKTFVYKKSNKIIKEAITNEINRGGQVFYVHNRIKDLEAIRANLEALIPNIRVKIAHGQMDNDYLEEILIDFWEKKFDVLVTTTIIEIGIDFPNANTIIIDDSYRYGLSQLYQLRGRVGRSHKRAYAYLLYPSYEKLTGNSKKRLEAIFEFQELGSGFNLALRDLEIRGAGSILGKSQHGYNDVGIELYSEFIRDEVENIKDNRYSGLKEKEFDIGIDYYIPSSYMPSKDERVYYYNRFLDIKRESDIIKLKNELIDRFGRYNKDIKNMFYLAELKLGALRAGFDKVLKRGNKLIFVKDDKEYKIDINGIDNKEFLKLIKRIIEKELINE